tara:strand:- start:448 stop:777 length:330 start_codon:yes stop_codon:yes gene_type:complete
MNRDPFDELFGSDFESELQANCFKAIQMIALIAKNPIKYAFYMAEIREIVLVLEESLDEIGLSGDEFSEPEVSKLDVVDMLFLKGSEGLKKYFKNMGQIEDFDDDDDRE